MGNKRVSNYEKFPKTVVKNCEDNAFEGYGNILKELKSRINKENFILLLDSYPGVDDDEILEQFKKLNPDSLILTKDLFKNESILKEQLKYNLTEDRVFGKMYYGEVLDFMDLEKVEKVKEDIKKLQGLTIIYGLGSRILSEGDLYVYLDMARWEIQKRFRNGNSNEMLNNSNEEILKKYKLGFFIEWRISDRHKIKYFDDIDYFLDTNIKNNPKLVSGRDIRRGLTQLTKQPFRTVPYFDPGVWGGQWMKDVCDLDRSAENYAWSFDGVPEENSLLLEINGVVVEIPAMNLVLYRPKELLGEKVYSRFGAEFPIRFDFLDTMDGGNLSLQVHPVTEYIKNNFGMQYTQDESYYILDTKENPTVYLGTKENINKEEMIRDLKEAEKGEIIFNDEKYINQFPVKKHDHILIPAGTCHSSGKNTMVLEISATPYIFTFKLWDWERKGLDGKPRPIHIEHGEKVINWDRNTKWVKENLINQIEVIKNEDYVEEKTGLHELEFIETKRYKFDKKIIIQTEDVVNMLNLVEGEEAIIESLNNEFEPFTVHYVETFIIPGSVKEFSIRPKKENEKLILMRAYSR